MSTLEEQVVSVIRREFSLGDRSPVITGSSRLVEDLGADSLDVVELTMELEQHYLIEIPDEDVEDWFTVGAVVDYLRGRGVEG